MGSLEIKIKSMLWDLPPDRKEEIVHNILQESATTFRMDEVLFIKALNTLNWYELIRLFGSRELVELLTDSTIEKLFPPKRRQYYYNARRLLRKYDVSASG